MIRNAMSVDVEDYFQVSAMEPHYDHANWDAIPCRVEANMDRILALFDRKGIKATFFTLAWVAERYPAMVHRIIEQGHELASHGYEHIRVTTQTPEQFRKDVIRTKDILEQLSGQAIRGYRAASYSIGRDNLWAVEILQETGHEYSSSIFPIQHDLYGMPEAPRFAFHHTPHQHGDGILEIPMTTVTAMGRRFPCAGGGWFRLLPYAVTRWAFRRVNTIDQQSGIFYFHPWEIDPDQPRPSGLSAKTRFRHYLNLKRMETRLSHLLDDFQWDRIDRIFLEQPQQGPTQGA